jgi:protein-S-isoprenylcysteine O-methyltransferase Ste14
VFGHALPASLFALFTAVKGWLVVQAASAVLAAGPGASAQAVLVLVVQVLGLLYYALLALVFVIRLPRLGGRRSVWTVAVALFASFAVLTIGILPDNQPRPALDGLGAALVGLGLVYSIWALVYLRRSFSFLPESRRLVRRGPYALSRHPLYLGETVAAVGVLLPVAGPPAVGLWVLNVAAQLLRIHWEEQVLRAQFPEYETYALRVPRYLPFVG